jgi:hypothetical protein
MPRHPQRSPVVIGVADHSGWAVLVSVAAVNGKPAVLDRRRVELIEKGVPNQPYHHETLSLGDTASERMLRQVRRSIAACTATAFDRLAADLSQQHRVSAIAIRQPPLASVPATVAEVHSSYYVQCRADGMLYHAAICAAAGERSWIVTLHPRGEELAIAADALRASAREVERFLNDLRHVMKSPWTAEHRNAVAAAIGTLSKQSKLALT